MPKFYVGLSRLASEDAAIVIYAEDEETARAAALEKASELIWVAGDWASNDCEIHACRSADDDDAIGDQNSSTVTP